MFLSATILLARILKSLDKERSSFSARKRSEEVKKSRKTRRRVRKGIQDQNEAVEGVMYEAGGF